MTQIMKIPWSQPDIGDDEKQAVQHVLDSGWVSMGSETELFEKELASYLGCRHVIVVNNGTSALTCALLAHPVENVVVPAYTFPATWNSVRCLRKALFFRDVQSDTFHMSPDISSSETVLNIPVSIAGLPLNTETWREHILIEDGCEAFGGETGGHKVGGQGWPVCFSFHTAKLLTTVEGGAIATDDTEFAVRCALIRSHGENPEKKYEFTCDGLNFRPTDISSAIGREQLRKIPQYLSNRQRIVQYYRDMLTDVVTFQAVPDYVDVHANMMFPILINNPDHVAEQLLQCGVETRRPWPPGLPLPNATKIYSQVLALPLFNTMTMEEVEYVISCLKPLLTS